MSYCDSYCSHGGVCELDPGHEGLHDSRYCQWADAEALTREAADAILATKPGGEGLVALWDLVETVERTRKAVEGGEDR